LLVSHALATREIQRALQSAAAIDVVAVGKAARPMLVAACESMSEMRLRHIVGVSPQTATELPSGARWFQSAHPVPDHRSVVAAHAVREVSSQAGVNDLLVVLLSGGASALMALPADGVSLEDKRRASERLLKEGAEVHALNTVRKHLSGIKGGQLAAIAGGSVLTLAVSDVVGDDLSAIGSGPTVPDGTTFDEALAILEQSGGLDAYPDAVVTRLRNGVRGVVPETPKPGDARLARAMSTVIGGSRSALLGAQSEAVARGYMVHLLEEPVLGEARAAGRALLDRAARLLLGRPGKHCILAAGETTVRVSGQGKGGRNQECALAMADGIGRMGEFAVAASVGTDGVDGPTDAAGGVVDPTTVARAMAAGIGAPDAYLNDNNSYEFFDALGDLIHTGPTGTNVGDVQIILVNNT
jgi:hydroxypyruvate reductase